MRHRLFDNKDTAAMEMKTTKTTNNKDEVVSDNPQQPPIVRPPIPREEAVAQGFMLSMF